MGLRKPSQATRVQMAADLRLLLAEEGAKIVPSAQARESAALLHDLGQSSTLQLCSRPRLHSGRWLRQGDLQALNRRLRRPQTAEGLHAHRRNAWLALLAFRRLRRIAGQWPLGGSGLGLAAPVALPINWRLCGGPGAAPHPSWAQFPLASAGFTDVRSSELLRCLPHDGFYVPAANRDLPRRQPERLSQCHLPHLGGFTGRYSPATGRRTHCLGHPQVTVAQQFAVTADGERLLDDQAPLVAALPLYLPA